LFDRLGRQPFVIVTLWVVAAVLAVLVGVVGIGVVGAGLTSRQGAPISEEEVLREVNGLNESSSPTTAPTTAPTASTPATTPTKPAKPTKPAGQSFPTRVVTADCDGIIAMAPAQGYGVHEQSSREGEFRGVSDNHKRVKVELRCSGGVVDLRIRTEN
jgi:hypothetical protein